MTNTTTSRTAQLKIYSEGSAALDKLISRIPEQAIDYRPGPGKWSIREIVLHLADSEANSYIRCRKGIAESGSSVVAYAQDAWAEKLNYAGSNLQQALELIRLLRSMNSNLLNRLPAEAWETVYFHPESGRNTLDDWLANYAGHFEVHLKQIERNLESFSKNN